MRFKRTVHDGGLNMLQRVQRRVLLHAVFSWQGDWLIHFCNSARKCNAKKKKKMLICLRIWQSHCRSVCPWPLATDLQESAVVSSLLLTCACLSAERLTFWTFIRLDQLFDNPTFWVNSWAGCFFLCYFSNDWGAASYYFALLWQSLSLYLPH